MNMDNWPVGHPMTGTMVTLRPISGSDLGSIYEWRNDPASLYLWYQSRRLLGHGEFQRWLESALGREIDVWLMVISIETGQPVGFVYNYDSNPYDGFSFICVYIAAGQRGKYVGREAGALFVRYLMDYYPFRKLYADVFEFNRVSQTFIKEYGFIEEGHFPAHRYYQGRYWGMARLALYRERWLEVEQRVLAAAGGF